MGKSHKGRAGCGCLLFILIVCVVVAAAFLNPYSLRFMAGRFHYADKIEPCDAIFVPLFDEDKKGEVYTEAFREYWAGNGKTIWVENETVFGLTMQDIVTRMAAARGIKANVVKALSVEGEGGQKAERIREMLARHGVKKVLVIVPEYASRRFHTLYGSGVGQGKTVTFLVKPVNVPYFKTDKWWKDDLSRRLVEREIYAVGSHYVGKVRGKPGDDKQKNGEMGK